MDAPPDLEPSTSFVELATAMSDAGIQVPKIDHLDLDLGFLILSDFGDIHLQDAIESQHRNQLYDLSIEQIHRMQILEQFGRNLEFQLIKILYMALTAEKTRKKK